MPADLFDQQDVDRMKTFIRMVGKYTANNVLILFENVSKTNFDNYILSYVFAKYHLSKIKKFFKKNMGMTIDTAHVIGSGFSL